MTKSAIVMQLYDSTQHDQQSRDIELHALLYNICSSFTCIWALPTVVQFCPWQSAPAIMVVQWIQLTCYCTIIRGNFWWLSQLVQLYVRTHDAPIHVQMWMHPSKLEPHVNSRCAMQKLVAVYINVHIPLYILLNMPIKTWGKEGYIQVLLQGDDTATCGTWLDDLAIRSNSSKIHKQ